MAVMPYFNVKEEELKNKIAQDYFENFDCSKIIGDIDFCVSPPSQKKNQNVFFEIESLFWAEAKKGKANSYKSIVQLILTIGKSRLYTIKTSHRLTSVLLILKRLPLSLIIPFMMFFIPAILIGRSDLLTQRPKNLLSF